MPDYGIILKLTKGSEKPEGYDFVRTLRTVDIYKKKATAPVPQAEIEDIISGFSRMGITAKASAVDELEKALAGLSMQGGARKSRRRRGGKGKGKGKGKKKTHRRHH
jgi:hypothetical protein